MTSGEFTGPTERYPADALEDALRHISSQGLWLLLSLDQYGWRAEIDVIRRLVGSDGVPDPGDRINEHAPLVAVGQMFALVDKLWRLIYAIRAHRAGREFLNAEDGYLAGGYKLHKKIDQLRSITVDEWRELLAVPPEADIAGHMATVGATSEELANRITFARELPGLLATNMTELAGMFDRDETIAGPRDMSFSLRELDDQYRHGAPVVYLDCSPSTSRWIGVLPDTGDTPDELVGMIMMPPDQNGAAFIARVACDVEMAQGLLRTATNLGALVRRLARAHLVALSPGLIDDPLAAVADYRL